MTLIKQEWYFSLAERCGASRQAFLDGVTGCWLVRGPSHPSDGTSMVTLMDSDSSGVQAP